MERERGSILEKKYRIFWELLAAALVTVLEINLTDFVYFNCVNAFREL